MLMQRLSEEDFLKVLENKASEEKRILSTEMMPRWAKGLGEWLVVNPWRVLVPLSCVLYLVFRIMYGSYGREMIMELFGGY